MAKIGLKYFAWAKLKSEAEGAAPVYESGKVVGKIASINRSITLAEGELAADDMTAEYASEFVEGDLSAEIDYISLADKAAMLGGKYEESTGYVGNANDTAPYGAVGGIQVLMKSGVRKFRAYVHPKVKAMPADMEGTTKGKNISFATEPVKMKIMALDNGDWIYENEFEEEDEAKAFVFDKLGITEAAAASTEPESTTT